jgi:hypothetical protein
MRKLEESSVIEQYTVRLNRQKLGYRLLAMVFVNIEKTELNGPPRFPRYGFAMLSMVFIGCWGGGGGAPQRQTPNGLVSGRAGLTTTRLTGTGYPAGGSEPWPPSDS